MHKTILSLVVTLALAAPTIAAAQMQRRVAPMRATAVPVTGYAVGINTPLTNNNPLENPQSEPLIIVAYCNATSAAKDLEGWVGQNNPVTVQNMVASLSGNGRQTITFVVPWGWYYRINVVQQPGGGIPPGGQCQATAWWTD